LENHPDYFPTMSQRRVEISHLQPQQLAELRKSTELEIQHFTQSLQALQTAQSKLQDCMKTIDNMELATSNNLLVPMTSSLYLPGKVSEKDKYLVDIGTGYFVEKNAKDAKQVYQKKLTKLGEDSKKLRDILVLKNESINNINMVLRKKMMEAEAAQQ